MTYPRSFGVVACATVVAMLCGCSAKFERVSVYDEECASSYSNPLLRDLDLIVPKHNGAPAAAPQKAFRVIGGERRHAAKFECGVPAKEGYVCCNASRDAANEWQPFPK